MENKIKSYQLEWSTGNVKGFQGKELLNINNGSFKLIKISPLSAYPIHVHPDKTEYAYVLEGTPEFIIENTEYTSVPGDFFIFPLKMEHAIKNNTHLECLLLVGAVKA